MGGASGLCGLRASEIPYPERNRDRKRLVWQIRAAFLVSVFAFVIPASICALGMFQGKIVLLDNSRQDLEPDNIIQVDESSSVSQDLTMEGSVLSNLKIRVYTGEKSISDTLTVELIDKETGDVVYQGEKETDGFTTNSALYSFIGEKFRWKKEKRMSCGSAARRKKDPVSVCTV